MRSLVNKVFVALTTFGMGKYQHIAFGALIACIAALAACWLPQWATVTISVLFTVSCSIGKEVYDECIDWRDLLATMLGGATVWIALLIH